MQNYCNIFYVDADQQGKGIGAKLMQAAKESAKQLEAHQLYISATQVSVQ